MQPEQSERSQVHMINVAVLGYGTVGSGVVEVLERNKAQITQRAGREVNVKYILDLRDFPGDPYEAKVVHDADVILNDPEVHVVCETMGGLHPAYEFSKRALESGKSVCTSNKELVAAYGPELIALAKEKKCSYLFEASVGGGIPIIRPINDCLTAERIEAVTGILNGTTNYILTKMAAEGAEFETVLKEAQDKGYAERNPEADVEGHDACRKIAILTSLVTGKHVSYEEIYTEGITKITPADFAYAKSMGRSIKLLAMSRCTEDGCYAMVAPFMIPDSHPLYSVNDVFNAVFVQGNMMGDSMYYGRGAGKLPTASAVVSDVVESARNLGGTDDCFWDAEKLSLTNKDSISHRFFVRTKAELKEKAAELFGAVEEVAAGESVQGEYAFVTPAMTEKEFADQAEKLGCVWNRIRMEDK